jgi:hypothetical protein
MGEDPDREEALMTELRAFFAEVDPVPELVNDTAKASLGWRRLDADLAELLSDSALEEESVALARGSAISVRSLTFTAAALMIDVEIHHDDDTPTLLGQLSPPAAATIEVQMIDGRVVSTETDRLGRFRVSLSNRGAIRLRVLDRVRRARIAAETSWVTI